MGRTRMLRLAVVAVLALAGVVASSASAAPEWKSCVKTEPKNTGAYTDKLCTVESPGGEGAYELVPSVGKGKGFKGKGGPTNLHLGTPEDFQVKCTSLKYEGKLALPNLIKEGVITFKGCKGLAAPCQSGIKKGVIVTNSLAGEMIDIESGSGVGSLLEAEAGPTAPLATFACTEVLTRINVLGSVIAERTGDIGVISKEAQDHFVVGPAPEEATFEGKHWRPLVNIPTHRTGDSDGEHFLRSEITEYGHTEPAATLPFGLEGVTNEKGEARMIVP